MPKTKPKQNIDLDVVMEIDDFLIFLASEPIPATQAMMIRGSTERTPAIFRAEQLREFRAWLNKNRKSILALKTKWEREAVDKYISLTEVERYKLLSEYDKRVLIDYHDRCPAELKESK